MAKYEDVDDIPLPNRQLRDNLAQVMIDRQLSGSEVARRSGLTRDNISRYQRGESFPMRPQLEKLARGLRLASADLVPCLFNGDFGEDPTLARKKTTGGPPSPTFSIQASDDDPNMAWLRISRLVRIDTALAVMRLIKDAEESDNVAANRAASG